MMLQCAILPFDQNPDGGQSAKANKHEAPAAAMAPNAQRRLAVQRTAQKRAKTHNTNKPLKQLLT